MRERIVTNDELVSGLNLWAETRDGLPTLINLSENHTYRIDGPGGLRHILRVHRPGYQSQASIESELVWLEALRREAGLPVPRPLPGRDGGLVQRIGNRFAVLFAHERGREPLPSDDLAGLFRTLGRYSAIAHRHAEGFVPPAGFTRQVWDIGSILDADGLWGDWRRAPNMTPAHRLVLDRLETRLRAIFAGYGMDRDRFGLIHADMRLANLLVDGQAVTLIDFDDCGFCWFVYDFAAAISFHETHPDVPRWRAAWIEGYRQERALSEADIAALDASILLRRMALLAWIGSHGETDLAESQSGHFSADTVRLAEAFLR